MCIRRIALWLVQRHRSSNDRPFRCRGVEIRSNMSHMCNGTQFFNNRPYRWKRFEIVVGALGNTQAWPSKQFEIKLRVWPLPAMQSKEPKRTNKQTNKKCLSAENVMLSFNNANYYTNINFLWPRDCFGNYLTFYSFNHSIMCRCSMQEREKNTPEFNMIGRGCSIKVSI